MSETAKGGAGTRQADRDDTTSAAFFEAKYRSEADPWKFGTSPYEQGRYDRAMAALAGRRYRRGFEPGASIGVLSRRLAMVCDELVTLEISETAAARARAEFDGDDHVQVTTGALPEAMPEGTFDLIVMSEIGYYFGEMELHPLAGLLVSRLRPRGVLLGVHWLGTSTDHRLSGDRVHAIVALQAALRLDHAERHQGFRLDRWVRS